MFCITLDKDGKEIAREQKPKRWCPRNGFQRGKDGNFYKKLGDPRIIPDPPVVIEKEKEKLPPLRTPLPAPACDSGRYTTELYAQRKYTFEEYKAILRTYQEFIRGFDHSYTVEYRRAIYRKPIGIMTIDRIPIFERMDVFPHQGLVKLWISRKGGEPDYLIRNIIKP